MHSFLDLVSYQPFNEQLTLKDPEQKSLSKEVIRKYWERLFLDINLLKGDNDTLTIAVPYFYDCLNRSIIKNILNTQYGFENITILPRSLALVSAYLRKYPEFDARGDLVCIFADEDSLDFSFISLAGSCITLERQCRGNWENLMEEAGRLGFYTSQGWEFNHLLYISPPSSADIQLSISELGKSMHRLSVEEANRTILEGLHNWSADQSTLGQNALRIVYPYDFYLETFDLTNNHFTLEKISFDTVNLELDLQGSYKIATLQKTNLYTRPEDTHLDLAVYELERTSLPQNPDNWAPTMAIRLIKEEVPDLIELWLEMDTANIFLARDSQKILQGGFKSANFLSSLNDHQEDLYRLLQNSSNRPLQEDLAHNLLYTRQGDSPTDHESLEKRLETTRLKLLALLQLWSGN